MRIALLALLVLILPRRTFSCTSIVAGPGATRDSSVWVGQSDDGEGAGDTRLVWVPAMDWPVGAIRPVVYYNGDYPRYVGTERAIPAYYPTKDLPQGSGGGRVIGSLPQVSHTYGYFEGTYAMSNDQGVAFGESSCSARTFALPVHLGGPSLLSMMELSRLAAERASTAREAVKIMGNLSEHYGFYADPLIDTGGESLLVADAREQFIFHVLAESKAVGGAVWAAQRIPSDHIAVVANAFAIGYVNSTDTDNFLHSANMHATALKNAWWDGKGLLHFTRTFSAGEYHSRYYSGRRMWAFWNVTAPSLGVPPTYDSYIEAVGTLYPTSARPDKLLTRDDILRRIYRNYYAGTPYDLTSGIAAGAFGSPARWKPGMNEFKVGGELRWERPIASFRSTLVYQTNIITHEDRTTDSVLWFVPGAALGGVFFPLPLATAAAAAVPPELATPRADKLDRMTAFWAFRELLQYAYPRPCFGGFLFCLLAIVHDHRSTFALFLAGWRTVYTLIAERQRVAEDEGERALAGALALARQGANTAGAGRIAAHVTDTVSAWRDLYASLLVQYSDGWLYRGLGDATPLGYPAWWLESVGYTNGPPACETPCP